MPLLPADREGIERAAELLRGGGVVAFPTETVYGLGAIAYDAAAVARIFEIKRRPHFDPLIVHVLDAEMFAATVSSVGALAERLIERFWPGPLTLVLRKCASVPALVTSGLSTVAVRMPSHPVARLLLASVGAPLAAPSANPFGALTSTRAEHVVETLGERVDLTLDGGRTEHGLESTIVALEPQPLLLRAGAIPVEAIEEIAGRLLRWRDGDSVRAPGQLQQHYAPRTPLRVIDPANVPAEERRGAAALTLRDRFEGYDALRLLSPSGDLRTAAAGFFEALHELDGLQLARIDAQPMSERSLGLAIMDRLRRAAGKRNA